MLVDVGVSGAMDGGSLDAPVDLTGTAAAGRGGASTRETPFGAASFLPAAMAPDMVDAFRAAILREPGQTEVAPDPADAGRVAADDSAEPSSPAPRSSPFQAAPGSMHEMTRLTRARWLAGEGEGESASEAGPRDPQAVNAPAVLSMPQTLVAPSGVPESRSTTSDQPSARIEERGMPIAKTAAATALTRELVPLVSDEPVERVRAFSPDRAQALSPILIQTLPERPEQNLAAISASDTRGNRPIESSMPPDAGHAKFAREPMAPAVSLAAPERVASAIVAPDPGRVQGEASASFDDARLMSRPLVPPRPEPQVAVRVGTPSASGEVMQDVSIQPAGALVSPDPARGQSEASTSVDEARSMSRPLAPSAPEAQFAMRADMPSSSAGVMQGASNPFAADRHGASVEGASPQGGDAQAPARPVVSLDQQNLASMPANVFPLPGSFDGSAQSEEAPESGASLKEGPAAPPMSAGIPSAAPQSVATTDVAPAPDRTQVDARAVADLVRSVTRTLALRDLESLDAGRAVRVQVRDPNLPVSHIELRGDGAEGLAEISLVVRAGEAEALISRKEELAVALGSEWASVRVEIRADAAMSGSPRTLGVESDALGSNAASQGGQGQTGRESGGSAQDSREDVLQALERIQRRGASVIDTQLEAVADFNARVVGGE